MAKKNNGYESEPLNPTPMIDVFDEDTDELPVLVLADHETDDAVDDTVTVAHTTESNAATREARASSWVTGMEAEIVELQERWKALDEDLRRSEQLTDAFRSESEEKDGVITKLKGEVADQLDQIQKLSSTVAERDSSIVTLQTERTQQDSRLVEKSDQLSAAHSQAAVLEDRLQAAIKDRDELSRKIAEEQSKLLAIRTKRDTIAATNEKLSTRVQDLEGYIEGRKDKWAALNGELAASKGKITDFESVIAASEQRFDGRGVEIESLRERIIELERLRSEAEGRHKERELAYQATQTRLTEQAAEIERLRAAANSQDSGIQLANETAEKHKAKLDSLKRALDEKDEATKSLEAKIISSQSLYEHLESKRVDDRKQIDELQRELTTMSVQRDQLSEFVATAESNIQALEQKLVDSEERFAEVSIESGDRQTRLTELEAQVAAKSEIIQAFDRNVERISVLKSNLHPIPLNQVSSVPTHLESPVGDAESRRDARHRARTNAKAKSATRLFIPLTADGAEHPEYSLSKSVMTIGRARSSDIRILDAVVSRTHARLTTDEDSTIIEDLGSKNGIFVNSHAVERAELQHGDVISFGEKHEFRYVEQESATG